jgi:hypothetical protein
MNLKIFSFLSAFAWLTVAGCQSPEQRAQAAKQAAARDADTLLAAMRILCQKGRTDVHPSRQAVLDRLRTYSVRATREYTFLNDCKKANWRIYGASHDSAQADASKKGNLWEYRVGCSASELAVLKFEDYFLASIEFE